MAFCNIQIGGSVFKQQETRSKQFTAGLRGRPNAPVRDAKEWAEAHENMYDEIIEFIDSCRRETRAVDAMRTHAEEHPET